MTPELTNQLTAGLLILWFAFLVSLAFIGSLIAAGYLKRRRTAEAIEGGIENEAAADRPRCLPTVFDSPCRWLAVQSSNLAAVQGALGLHNPTPCSWGDGVSNLPDERLFLSPPVNGWILVLGHGLPDPSDDVDCCYRFIRKLSGELGGVQFFSVNRVVNHHAWARAEAGGIVRAYAWGGQTLWNEGAMTAAETELGLKCFAYGEQPPLLDLSVERPHSANEEKIMLLAARWSLDPTAIDERMLSTPFGIAGDLFHSTPG